MEDIEAAYRHRGEEIAKTLGKYRSVTIKLCYLQMFVAVLRLLMFFIRRVLYTQSPFYLMANIAALITAVIGWFGAAKIHLYCVGVHALLCVSVLGTFFGFLVLELLFFHSKFDDAKLMAVMALPYAVDLVVGMSSVLLYAKMKEALSRDMVPEPLVDPTQPLLQAGENCVVCQEQKNECAFYPCGHKCVCKGCASRLVRTACPLCRKIIRDYIIVYE